MSDHLFALRLFARVARKGSFSAAGRELDIPQSTTSRTIAELDRRVNAPLLATRCDADRRRLRLPFPDRSGLWPNSMTPSIPCAGLPNCVAGCASESALASP